MSSVVTKKGEDSFLKALDDIERRFQEAKKNKPKDKCSCEKDKGRIVPIVQKMPDGFERRVQFGTAHRCDRPRGHPWSHGIGSMRIWFILVGPKGATQWLIDTQWYLGNDGAGMGERFRMDGAKGPKPDCWDLGYHGKTPRWDGQNSTACDLWKGPCYYDGSGLNGKEHVEPFLAQGPEYIWKMLREYYDNLFTET